MKRPLALPFLIAVLFLAVGLGVGYWFAVQRIAKGQAMQAVRDVASLDNKLDPKTDRKVLYWHDPMVPGTKFDKPGKSPFMDMPLVPVYADETADRGKVAISPRTEQNFGVRTAAVKQGSIGLDVSTVGAVSIDERGITAVQSRVSGYIEKLYVRARYDNVARGARLAEVYAPEWLSAEEEYLALKRMPHEDMRPIAEAARERLKLLGIPEGQIEALERSGAANPRVTLLAPESGVVVDLSIREGMAVSPGMTLFTLASLRNVWVNAELPEAQAALVKPGAKVEARVAALPDRIFKGEVASLLPDVNAATRTLKARIVVSNPAGELKPGMFATLRFGVEQKQALLVPSEAVIATGKRNVVVLASEGKFQSVEVHLGRESAGMTEIVSGLQAGQQVVVSGQFLIDSEASLKGVETRMAEAKPTAPAAMNVHRARGKVEKIGNAEITISHGPVPTLSWGAMTMSFKLLRGGLPNHITVGDNVDFEFRSEDGGYAITRIVPAEAKEVKP
jgi:membrane fusion protein, copper/silver efflux system